MTGEAALEEDDEVSFEAGVNVATSARKATSVQLVSKSNDTAVRRELGQVCHLFLRVCVSKLLAVQSWLCCCNVSQTLATVYT